ncbi:MAG TPA: hypothetical protein VK698_25480 [Kofleriaceae bacterium]|nr:hypothetical protein [Kofleriaceae bacterium]
METERPALPATDDPFELLGVTPPSTELELRRAYVRRSKQFRPERAPEEFKRIRRAYEQALARLHWSIYVADAPDDDDGDTPAADGEASDVVGAPAVVPEPAPSEPPAPPIESRDELVRALLDRRPVPLTVLDGLPADELDQVARHSQIDWAVLREQPDRWLALELYSLRLQRLLMDGDVGQALEEIGSAPVRGDLLALPALEHLVARVLIACAWTADPRAERLFSILGGQGEVDWQGPLGLCAEARSLAPLWKATPEVRACVPLARFVELFPSVAHNHRRQLVADLAGALATRRQEVVAALDAMGRTDARLLVYLHLATEGMVYGEELAYEDLAPREKGYIADAMKTIELVDPARLFPRVVWAVAFATVLIGRFLIGGRWGTIVGVTLLSVVAIPYYLHQLGRVARETRAHVADAVIATGLRPDRMLEWAEERGRVDGRSHRLPVIEDGLRDDLVLHTLARLARIARQWTAPLPQKME